MPIDVAIIGAGSMAASHARAYSAIEGVRIREICDVRPEKAQALATEFGIDEWSDDASGILGRDDIDAVSIVTPDATHAELSIAALRAGKHVLCEKPLSTDASSALEMAQIAEQSGRINMVNFSYRRSAALEEAGRLVAKGDFGRIRHVDARYFQSWLVSDAWGDWRTDETWLWRLSKDYGSAGVLGDIGVHMLDFITLPVGEPMEIGCELAVLDKAPGGKIGPYTLDANDSAVISLRFEGGAMGILQLSRWTTGHLNSICLGIHGDRGAVRIDLDKGYDRLEVCLGDDVRDAVWREVDVPAGKGNHQRFVEAIASGRNAQPDFKRGARVQAWLDACHESSRIGRRVSLA